MTKTTSILWLLGFALLLRLEKLDATLVLVVVMIATGLFMFVYHYTGMNLFEIAKYYSVSGLELQHQHYVFFYRVPPFRLPHRPRGRYSEWRAVDVRADGDAAQPARPRNPLDFMYHIQPVMLITLVPFLGALEGEL